MYLSIKVCQSFIPYLTRPNFMQFIFYIYVICMVQFFLNMLENIVAIAVAVVVKEPRNKSWIMNNL